MANKNSEQLDASCLTPSRQTLLSDALSGHSVDVAAGKFSPISAESLAKIGLAPIEIAALEKDNATGVGTKSLKIVKDATPSSQNNPYTKDNWNPDIQRQLHDTNPSLAQKLWKEANS